MDNFIKYLICKPLCFQIKVGNKDITTFMSINKKLMNNQLYMKVLLILISLIISMSLFGQNQQCPIDNKNGGKNIYLLDTLLFKSPEICLLKKCGYDFIYEKGEINPALAVGEDLIKNPNCFIFFYNYPEQLFIKGAELDILAENALNKQWWMNCENQDGANSYEYNHFDNYAIISFKTQPSYYRLALIRGNYLNYLFDINIETEPPTDKSKPYIDFKDQNSFYQCAIPVWQTDSIEDFSKFCNSFFHDESFQKQRIKLVHFEPSLTDSISGFIALPNKLDQIQHFKNGKTAILNINQSGTRAKVELTSTSDNNKSEIYFRLINGKWELFVFKDSCNFFNN